MRSATAHKAAEKRKRRPASVLRPLSRRTRNADPEGKAFMKFVRQYPCLICRIAYAGAIDLFDQFGLPYLTPQFGPTRFAHIGGTSAAKAQNFHGIPLCDEHHNSNNPACEHKLKAKFGPHWGIDVEVLILRLRAEWEASRK